MANGCNIYGPDSPEGESCCDRHDKHYVKGDVSKAQADLELFKCVKAAGFPVEAAIMYAAVSTGGWVLWSKYRLRDKFGWFPKAKDK